MRQVLLVPLLLAGLLSALIARRPARRSVGMYATFHDYGEAAETTRGWLHSQGLPSPPQRFSGAGGGGVRTRGRLLGDAGACGGRAHAATPTSSVTTAAGQSHAEIGLILIETPCFRVYPLAGAGLMGGIALAHTCDETRAPVRHEAPGWVALLVHGGVGIDFMLRLELFTGVRMGWRTGLITAHVGSDHLAPPQGAFVRGALGARWVSRD